MSVERAMPENLKQFVADEMKKLVKTNLRYTLQTKGWVVSQVDTADNLQAHISIRTDFGPRVFTIQIKEIH